VTAGTAAGSTARHAELFDALVALFLAEGFARATLDDLAARLRCSKSTLYQLAPSKDELVRAVAVHFFRAATARVEAALEGAGSSSERVQAYLRAIGRELRPGSDAFFADLAASRPAGEVYRRNTAIAAERVGQLLADGARTGEFRAVRAAFVADLVAAQMVRVQQGAVRASTGLDDAAAYDALADLVLHGVASGG
jgi:AcrR family transcriptional regulator